MSEPDFIVLGKTQSEADPSVKYLCKIHDDTWLVPDDMDNADRQRVQLWIDAGNSVPDLTPEDVATKLNEKA